MQTVQSVVVGCSSAQTTTIKQQTREARRVSQPQFYLSLRFELELFLLYELSLLVNEFLYPYSVCWDSVLMWSLVSDALFA